LDHESFNGISSGQRPPFWHGAIYLVFCADSCFKRRRDGCYASGRTRTADRVDDDSQSNTWSNVADDRLPASVEVNGAPVAVKWRLKPELGEAAGRVRKVVFVYECAEPRLRLRWQWEARADIGPVEHRVTIENLSGQEVWLPMVDSLRLDLRLTPARICATSMSRRERIRHRPMGRILRPSPMLQLGRQILNVCAPRAGRKARDYSCGDGLRSGWRTERLVCGHRVQWQDAHFSSTFRDRLSTVLGLNPEPGPFKTRLEPNETFETPTVFLGTFKGGPDGAGNQLRCWVRAVSQPARVEDPQYPLMVNNSWAVECR